MRSRARAVVRRTRSRCVAAAQGTPCPSFARRGRVVVIELGGGAERGAQCRSGNRFQRDAKEGKTAEPPCRTSSRLDSRAAFTPAIEPDVGTSRGTSTRAGAFKQASTRSAPLVFCAARHHRDGPDHVHPLGRTTEKRRSHRSLEDPSAKGSRGLRQGRAVKTNSAP